jgi:hypothetical protein
METALLDMGQAEQSDLQLLEEQFAAARQEIVDLDQSALVALKSLDKKDGKPDDSFDIERYRDLKRKLQARLPILEQKLLGQRIRHLQARREELQKELADIQPEQVKTKAHVIQAEELLRQALEAHYKQDFRAASIENELAISLEELRTAQRRSQELIKALTGLESPSDGPSANEQKFIN